MTPQETFLIRGETLDSINLSKPVISNEMSAHGFHLEIEGEGAPVQTQSFVSSPSAHQSQRQAPYTRTDAAVAASRASASMAPSKLSATPSSVDSPTSTSYPTTSALPTPIHRSSQRQHVGTTAGGRAPSHHAANAEVSRMQAGDETASKEKFIWVEQNGKLVMMKVEDESRWVLIKMLDLRS